MILIGIGSNLSTPLYGSPLATATAALASLSAIGIQILRQSRWYLSEPVPPSDQPWYVNAVAVIGTRRSPPGLLAALLALETRFGRQRGSPNAARTLDLDLLDFDGRRYCSPRLTLPHPHLHQRRFVLAPLAEVAPNWHHPARGLTAGTMLAHLPSGQSLRAIGDWPPAPRIIVVDPVPPL
jgi:2-amino-4-hydroxy-6-hydroxymethyldihydropteridine diphosphokinase